MRDAGYSFGEWPDFFEEPEGWRELQERARSEQDPRKLEAIIAEMNQLLTECENKVKGMEAQSVPRPSKGKKPSADKQS